MSTEWTFPLHSENVKNIRSHHADCPAECDEGSTVYRLFMQGHGAKYVNVNELRIPHSILPRVYVLSD